MGSVFECGVMNCNATVAVFCPKVDKAAGLASSGCFKWAAKGGNSSLVHRGSSMNGFKVACIFAKVEFVGYVSNMCTVWLRLELSCNFCRLGIEFGSYFISLGLINMRALPCNRETT